MRTSQVGMRYDSSSPAAALNCRPRADPRTPVKDYRRNEEHDEGDDENEPRLERPPRVVHISPSPSPSSPRDGSGGPISRNGKRMKRAKEEIQQLSDKNQRLKDRISQLREDNKFLLQNNKNLVEQAKLLAEEKEHLDSEVRRLAGKGGHILNERKLLEANLQASKDALATKKQLLEEVTRQRDDLKEQVGPLESETNELSSCVLALKDVLRGRDEELQSYKVALKQRDQEWGADRIKLEELKKSAEMLKTLQQQVLAGVDRHEPTFDETIHSRFIIVNAKINSAVRTGGKGLNLYSLFASTPFNEWTQNAIPSHSYNSKSPILSVNDKRTVKLLMRLAIWNFVKKTLFNRENPFAVFGASVADNLTEDYVTMFGHSSDTSETAAKWRAMTAHRLAELDKKAYQDRVLKTLLEEFAAMIRTEIGYREQQAGEIDDLLRGGAIHQRIAPVLQSAMDLARLVSQERAGYTLKIPNLLSLRYHKANNSEELTNRATLVNIDAVSSEEEEAGMIALVASPMLLKWGSGSGDQLSHRTVLEKAFVLVESSWQQID